VEKAVKALSVYHSAAFPRTHSIGTLLDLLTEYLLQQKNPAFSPGWFFLAGKKPGFYS